jgi:hypothetical protein
MITIPVSYEELLAHKAAGRIALDNVFYTEPVSGRSDFNVWAAFSVDSSRVFKVWATEVPATFLSDFSAALLVDTLTVE